MNREYIKYELNKLFPDAKCELEYNHDYELLISTMLSAQSTDKRVNEVAKELYLYSLEELNKLSVEEIEKIIKPVGTFHKKALFIKNIVNIILSECDGMVPCDRNKLESMPGVGRKTANVVLANLYNVPTFAVDTHVFRIAKRLGITNENDDLISTENKLCSFFDKESWNKINDQIILFGRYKCKAIKPDCENCPFKLYCKK